MDKVRLGRALGYGARHAARTLWSAAEAVSAPDPAAPSRPAPASATKPAAANPTPAAANPTPAAVADPAPRTRPSTRERVFAAAPVVAAETQRAGRSVWRPFAKFSTVLWLEITGSFFALFAFALGRGAWALRGAPLGSADRSHLWAYTALCLLFTYFTLSSFFRARRRHRR